MKKIFVLIVFIFCIMFVNGQDGRARLWNKVPKYHVYDAIDSFLDSGIEKIDANNMLDVISSCVLQIYENKGEKVYQAKDQTKKELTEFIESMNSGQFRKLQSFFDTMPKLKHTIKVKNPKTKKSNDVTLTGLNDFFG